jgi:CheY-like chemotaxis protein
MKKILVVDDEGDIRMILRIIIDELGDVEFLEAENGKEGLDMAVKHDPDLIIMDYKMPEMNGLDATTKIRNSMTKEIPVLLHTAYLSKLDKKNALDVGCTDVIEKPVDFDSWITKISRYIK